MSSQSQDFANPLTLYATTPDSSPAISSPPHSHQRTGSFEIKNISKPKPKPKRNHTALSEEDPAMVAGHRARMKDEFYLLEGEWREYPWSARPKTRREELQMLPRLCNDFESFDKQMARLDRMPNDPGLLSQIRAYMNERAASLERKREEAERQKRWEGVSRTIEGVKELLRHDDTPIKQRGEEIREVSREVRKFSQDVHRQDQGSRQIEHRADNYGYEVRSFGMSLAQRRRRIHQVRGEGRNTF
ncbi:hypothetical protein EVG20_g4998 [Dentipellis fragilis]|uniref:Uncharacterized protein n=1 Tax=Dentipellis fragilis TaxID=205917 RepID=A0A4Y9YV36_9AGAM|nr:hypothetical protein EVG20_g4998 [Dentipellis fragilis]